MIELLTVDETAARLRMTAKGIYRAIRDGRVPAIRIGRRVRIPAESIERLIADQMSRPQAPAADQAGEIGEMAK